MRSTGFTGDFAAFLKMLRTDPRFYPKTGEQLLKEGVLDRQAHGREAAVAVRPTAAAAVRGGARARLPRAQVHGRSLQRQSSRRHRAGVLLAQHVRARDATALQPRGAHAARGRARASPADRARQRGCRRAEVPPLLVHLGVRRRLGTVLGVARSRGRLLHRPLQQLRSPDVCDVARRAARRRHWHARQGLDAPAVDRLPRRQHRAVAARVHDRDGSLHQLARTGPVLQDGRAQDPRTARPRRDRRSARRSIAAASTMPSSPTARCRCRCSNSRSTRSSRESRRADARLPVGLRRSAVGLRAPTGDPRCSCRTCPAGGEATVRQGVHGASATRRRELVRCSRGNLSRGQRAGQVRRLRDSLESDGYSEGRWPHDEGRRVFNRSVSRPARSRAAGRAGRARRRSAGRVRTACRARKTNGRLRTLPSGRAGGPPRRHQR